MATRPSLPSFSVYCSGFGTWMVGLPVRSIVSSFHVTSLTSEGLKGLSSQLTSRSARTTHEAVVRMPSPRRSTFDANSSKARATRFDRALSRATIRANFFRTRGLYEAPLLTTDGSRDRPSGCPLRWRRCAAAVRSIDGNRGNEFPWLSDAGATPAGDLRIRCPGTAAMAFRATVRAQRPADQRDDRAATQTRARTAQDRFECARLHDIYPDHAARKHPEGSREWKRPDSRSGRVSLFSVR